MMPVKVDLGGPMAEAGWYPDANAPGMLRWFDGTAWTPHTALDPTVTPTANHAPPSQPPISPRSPAGPAKTNWRTGLLAALGVVLLVGVSVALVELRPSHSYQRTFYVPSVAMSPTIRAGDTIGVKTAFGTVHRGDVLVFGRPPGEPSPVTAIVKRVVGMPGETIASGPNGEVLIDGTAISQPWLTQSAQASPGPPIRSQTIPPDEYFVLGDNRDTSEDSRFYGPVPASIIIGRVVVVVSPSSRAGPIR
jgi:signal peptidase I